MKVLETNFYEELMILGFGFLHEVEGASRFKPFNLEVIE